MTISVFLADDNLIVRMGVRALLDREPDLEVVGVAADYDELVPWRESSAPAAKGGYHHHRSTCRRPLQRRSSVTEMVGTKKAQPLEGSSWT